MLWLAILAFITNGRELLASDQGPAKGDSGAARRWAVVVGVDSYTDTHLDCLDHCSADANLIADCLRDNCGFDEARILRMTSKSIAAAQRPTRDNFNGTVHDWLRLPEDGDMIVFFFAGHGLLDNDQSHVLATEDCRKDSVGATGYRTEHLKNDLRDCKATRKLLILDCCHSGAAREGNPTSEPSSEEIAETFKSAVGLLTLASCMKDEKSHPWPEKEHGLFSYYLAEGLKGAADLNHDGIVTSDELYEYVFSHVRPYAVRNRFEQTPIAFRDQMVGVFDLAYVAKKLEQDGGNAEYWALYESGVSFVAQGKTEEAIAKFQKARDLWPGCAKVHYALGNALFDKKDFGIAIESYTKAIQLDPNNCKVVLVKRAETYKNLKEYAKALADCDEAIRLDSYFVLAYGVRGELHMWQREHDLAISDFTKAIDLRPTFSCLYVDRGESFMEKGDDEHALQDFAQVVRLGRSPLASRQDWSSPYVYDPGTEGYCWCPEIAYADRCLIYLRRNDAKRAIQEGDKAVKVGEKYAFGYYARGRAYYQAGDLQRALDDLNKAIEYAKGQNANFYYARYLVHNARREDELAEADRKKALELNPVIEGPSPPRDK